ncbi:hypothetical protein llap_13336 [Limosa lapponica baueri]|uniref:Uncharacterized protein n=1 Tax=Limosa lapponica baueri TaxID=1758121 RepID=A0A2I0TRD9_LIMLA|nr:hypothetical protein llap_13336 [Limosa lapponica baueri]
MSSQQLIIEYSHTYLSSERRDETSLESLKCLMKGPVVPSVKTLSRRALTLELEPSSLVQRREKRPRDTSLILATEVFKMALILMTSLS